MNTSHRLPQLILGLVIWLVLGQTPAMLFAQTFIYKQAALITGTEPRGLAVADFNADGRLDVAAANRTDNTVSVVLSNPDGTYSSKVDYAAGKAPVWIVSADLNGDHTPDLAVLNNQEDTISILIGKSDGTFQNQVTYSTGTLPVAIVAVDLNGDSKLDLAVANQGDGSVTALLGNGDGTFQSQIAVGSVSGPIALSTGDFNGDGKPDLVAATINGQIVCFQNSGGTFTSSTTAIGTTVGGIAVGDFNGDGYVDVAATVPSAEELVVLLGDGKGNFQTTYTPHPETPATLAAGDFNGDGKLDLAAGSAFGPPSTVSILLGVGDGTFKQPSYAGFPGSSAVMAIGDFNNDGYLDIAAADAQDNRVLIKLGNGDGSLESLATLPLPAAAGPAGSASADFNGDGKLDVAVTQFNQNSGITGFISVLPGNEDGTFGSPVSTQVPNIGIGKMVAGDFNGDGKQDIATSIIPATGGISVVLGKGDGSFGAAVTNPVNVNGTVQYMIGGNFNNDGRADLALLSLDGSNAFSPLNVLLSNGDGTFTPKLVQNVTGIATGLTSGDFNHDGKMDLAALDPQGAVNPDVLVFLGHGDGTFGSPVSYSTSTFFANDITTADFNGDGKADLAVGTEQGIYFFAGNGDGSFQAAISTATPQSVKALFVGDYNGDGKLDLFLVGPGDLFLGNGDGTFRQSVPLQPTFGLSVIFAAAGDFNGDGVMDLFQFSGPNSFLQTPPTASFWRSAPTVSLSASQLSFATQEVGTSSVPAPVDLDNVGNAPLSITSVAASSGFSENDSCPHALPIEQSCSLDVTFSPIAGGPTDGSLTIRDNDLPGKQFVQLSGSGNLAGTISLAPAMLTFPPQPIGSRSFAQVVTVTNSSSTALHFDSISASLPFAETNTCGSSLAAGASCAVSVTFTPDKAGSASSNLIFIDSANGAQQAVPLGGTGTAFTVSSQSSKLTIGSAGGSTSDVIQVTPLSGFTGTLNLTCSVTYAGPGAAVNQPGCSVSPASGQIAAGGSAFSTTLSVTTTAPGNITRLHDFSRQTGGVLAVLFCVGLIPLPRWKRALLTVVVATTIGFLTNGCGNSAEVNLPSNPATTAGNYSVVITASGSSITASTSIPLIVQ
jgi:FG-GAP-like repeat/Abnormal spindle-like microcephaly-assoc'd, ASPM-SPD-2-Hydin